MESLPSSIEAYLLEAGFSGTEIIILKTLLNDNGLTLRELAAKTGKSTGVLDQAVKKLSKKKIISRESINGIPKYKLVSLTSIMDWMQEDTRVKKEILERRNNNFEMFINSLTVGKKRPEIEYFEGIDGMKKAFDKLLEYRTELLTYFDPESVSNPDPLSDFLAQYSRKRQVHGIFQRIIAPDSTLARRFRSRDPFEYRKTVLVAPEDFPVLFQKTIAGDVVACMYVKSTESSFIQFPELAESERNAFERLWHEQAERERNIAKPSLPQTLEAEVTVEKESVMFNIPQIICIAFSLFLCFFWILLFSLKMENTFYNYIYSYLYGVTPFFGGIFAFFYARKWGGFKTSLGKAVAFVGIGTFLWGLGETIWAYYNFILGISVPYPSFADFAYAPSAFINALGIIFLADAAGAKFGLKNIYAKIFVTIAPLIVLMLSYYLLIVVARRGSFISDDSSILKTVIDIAVPLGDFVGLSVAVLISGLSFPYLKGKYKYEIWAMLGGLAIMFIADFTFIYSTTLGTYFNGHFVDLIYTFGLFLMSFGVLGFTTDKQIKPGTFIKFSK